MPDCRRKYGSCERPTAELSPQVPWTIYRCSWSRKEAWEQPWCSRPCINVCPKSSRTSCQFLRSAARVVKHGLWSNNEWQALTLLPTECPEPLDALQGTDDALLFLSLAPSQSDVSLEVLPSAQRPGVSRWPERSRYNVFRNLECPAAQRSIARNL